MVANKIVYLALLFSNFLFVSETTEESEVIIKTLSKEGDCVDKVKEDDRVTVHYTGSLESGKVFDSTHFKGRSPFQFHMTDLNIIKGWKVGILGMCVGEKRKLIIPPSMAYGAAGHPPIIPGGATLTFEIEVTEVGGLVLEQIIFKLLRLLVLPFTAVCTIYYLYAKQQKSSARREAKKKRKKN